MQCDLCEKLCPDCNNQGVIPSAITSFVNYCHCEYGIHLHNLFIQKGLDAQNGRQYNEELRQKSGAPYE